MKSLSLPQGPVRFGAIYQVTTNPGFRKLDITDQKKEVKTAFSQALQGQKKVRVYEDYIFPYGDSLYVICNAPGSKGQASPRPKFQELVEMIRDRLEKTLKTIPAEAEAKERFKENMLEILDEHATGDDDLALKLDLEERMHLDLKYLDLTEHQEERIRQDMDDTLKDYFVSIAKPFLHMSR